MAIDELILRPAQERIDQAIEKRERAVDDEDGS